MTSRYDFFISYAHEDLERVRRLDLALRELLRRPFRRSGFQVFRDERRLAAGSDLTERLRGPMRESQTLLVVLSAASARSVWVDREIAFWCDELGRADRMVLVRADPDVALAWDESSAGFAHAEALPPALVRATHAVPFYVELGTTSAADEEAAVRIAAAVLGRAPEEIAGEDFRLQQRRRRLTVGAVSGLSVLLVLAVVASVFAVRSSITAQRNERRAVADSLANRAVVEREDRPDKALALARAAHRYDVDSEGGDALLWLLGKMDGRDRLYRVDFGPTAAAVSPSGGIVALAGTDGGIRVARLPAAALPADAAIELPSLVVGMAFADEDRIVVGLADRRLVELTLDDSLDVQQSAETTVPLLDAFAFHAGSGLVAVGGQDVSDTPYHQEVTLVRSTPGALTQVATTTVLPGGGNPYPRALAFDVNGGELAVAGGTAAITLDVPSLQPAEHATELAAITAAIDQRTTAFLASGALAVGGDPIGSGFTNGVVAVYSTGTPRELGQAIFEQTVTHLISCQQSLFFGTEAGEFGSAPDPMTPQSPLAPFAGTRPFGDVIGAITALACSQAGTLVVASADGFIQVRTYAGELGTLDPSFHSAVRLLVHSIADGSNHYADVTGAAIVDGGTTLRTSDGRNVPLRGPDAQWLRALVDGQPESADNCLTVDQDGFGLIGGSEGLRRVGHCGDLELWVGGDRGGTVELRTQGRTLATIPPGDRLFTSSLAVSSDRGRLFVGGFLQGIVYDVSDPASPQQLVSIETQESTGGASFVSGGDVLLIGGFSPRGGDLEVIATPIGGEPLDRLACARGAGTLDGTLATQFLDAAQRRDLTCR